MKKTYLFILSLCFSVGTYAQNKNITIDNSFPYHVNQKTLGRATTGGDTIFISSARTKPLRFQLTNGNASRPLVVINKGGQVKIDSPTSYTWGAITLENCRYIKISGSGHPNFKYGFLLAANECGLAFSEVSSDCEAEFIKISHKGFFGIMAKKNYGLNTPVSYPVFENLIIHDCFIENVSEGMYLGETVSPGMEFKHVRIYNNIVRNTLRESIQIANMVEDVEIYNNTLLNAGLANITYQTNILQIGDNSVANVHDNILIKAPTTGIAVYGKGNCSFTNNYLDSNMGIFIDNRLFSTPTAPIEIKQNYFRAITGRQNIKNYNEINYVTARDNVYNTAIPFFLNQSGNATNFTAVNNTLTSVPALEFTDASTNDYSLKSSSPVAYQKMGAPGGPEYFEPIPQKIAVTAAMVVDLVPGGSLQSALFLFDEQNLSVQSGAHPSSNSWKPALAMNEAAYHVVVDLGKEYHLSAIDLHDMEDSYNFTVEYGATANWTTLFVNPCSTFNTWSKNKTNVTTRFLRFSMYQNVFAAVNEIIVYGTPVVPVVQQIVILPQMVTDLVQGGSVVSPLFLFDEQNINERAGAHAISTSWKPDYSMKKTSYHVLLDLGSVYHLSEINLHDMHDTKKFTVAYGDGTTWTPLFVDPCDTFKTWSINTTDVSTRYLRLSMHESVFAAVNEIFIYGYPAESNAAKSVISKKIENTSLPKSNFVAEKLEVFPNPVHDKMGVRLPPELIGKSNLVIKDLLGKTIYHKEVFTTAENSIIELTDFQLPTGSGVYVVSSFNESGANKALKFVKTN